MRSARSSGAIRIPGVSGALLALVVLSGGVAAAEPAAASPLVAIDHSTHVASTVLPAAAKGFLQRAELTASDGEANDGLGSSVALAGPILVASAPFATVDGHADEGALYVYVEPESGWANATEVAKLTVAGGKAGADLGENGGIGGSGLAISGNTIVAGADDSDSGKPQAGAVFVFVEPTGGWHSESQTAKLTAKNLPVGFDFGFAVAFDGTTIVATSPAASVRGVEHAGAAFVFTEPHAGWRHATQNATLTAPDPQQNDNFGWSVAVSDNTIVAGAPNKTIGGTDEAGAAYVFSEPAAGWHSTSDAAELTASDGQTGGDLGIAVAITADTVVTGAPNENQTGPGAAYVFVKPSAGWASETQTATLTATDHSASDLFAGVVAIDANTIVAEAAFADPGLLYIFHRPHAGWADSAQKSAITNPGISASIVSISKQTLVAGGPVATVNGHTDQGAVFVYTAGHASS